MFVQFVFELGVTVEVNDQRAQSDEIAVAFDLEFEVLFDGPANGFSLDSADLGGLGNGEPDGILSIGFSFGVGDSFIHRDEKKE